MRLTKYLFLSISKTALDNKKISEESFANYKFVDRFVDRTARLPAQSRTWRIYRGRKEDGQKFWEYSSSRPWTTPFLNRNSLPHIRPNLYVKMNDRNRLIFRGDMVEILVGPDKGKKGSISALVEERNWCFVKQLNAECMDGDDGDPYLPSSASKLDSPLNYFTEVALIDPEDNKRTTAVWRYTEEGQRVRISTRSGVIIPIPIVAFEILDPSLGYVNPSSYMENDKDTKEAQATEVTFTPSLKTFEQEIMEEMNILEERERSPTHWY